MIYLRTIDHEKVWKFMFYQCMRTQRKRGGRKNRGDTDTFIRSDYDLVMESYKDWFGNQSQPPPEPANPVGKSAMAQYKAALRLIYKNQVAVGNCGKNWDQIWLGCLENLEVLVRNRRTANNKKNHVEKVDHEFSPYTVVEEYPKIEAEMWDRGNGSSTRTAYSWIRHRFCLLFSTSGILRCESIYKAELSDFLCLHMKKETDPHILLVMIMQIPSGKSSKYV
jgi:hypothetical protein